MWSKNAWPIYFLLLSLIAGNFASDDQTLEMSRRVGEVSAALSDTVDLFDKCKKGKERVNKSSTHLRTLESGTRMLTCMPPFLKS